MKAVLGLVILASVLATPLVSAKETAAAPAKRLEQVQQDPATVTLSVWSVKADKAGKEIIKKAESAKPGDIIEYRAELRNQSRGKLNGQALTLPIPPGTAYVPASALPSQVQASTDGVKFEAAPLMQVVRNAQGQEEKVAVPLEAYRALRWPVADLPAGKSFQAKARVRVADTPAQAAKR